VVRRAQLAEPLFILPNTKIPFIYVIGVGIAAFLPHFYTGLPEQSPLEPKRHNDQLDAVVDQLLRDKDFLLSNEIKHKTDELNQLLVQAKRHKLKVELSTSNIDTNSGQHVSWLDVKIFKEI